MPLFRKEKINSNRLHLANYIYCAIKLSLIELRKKKRKGVPLLGNVNVRKSYDKPCCCLTVNIGDNTYSTGGERSREI